MGTSRTAGPVLFSCRTPEAETRQIYMETFLFLIFWEHLVCRTTFSLMNLCLHFFLVRKSQIKDLGTRDELPNRFLRWWQVLKRAEGHIHNFVNNEHAAWSPDLRLFLTITSMLEFPQWIVSLAFHYSIRPFPGPLLVGSFLEMCSQLNMFLSMNSTSWSPSLFLIPIPNWPVYLTIISGSYLALTFPTAIGNSGLCFSLVLQHPHWTVLLLCCCEMMFMQNPNNFGL